MFTPTYIWNPGMRFLKHVRYWDANRFILFLSQNSGGTKNYHRGSINPSFPKMIVSQEKQISIPDAWWKISFPLQRVKLKNNLLIALLLDIRWTVFLLSMPSILRQHFQVRCRPQAQYGIRILCHIPKNTNIGKIQPQFTYLSVIWKVVQKSISPSERMVHGEVMFVLSAKRDTHTF